MGDPWRYVAFSRRHVALPAKPAPKPMNPAIRDALRLLDDALNAFARGDMVEWNALVVEARAILDAAQGE